jgi:hypothetical protein
MSLLISAATHVMSISSFAFSGRFAQMHEEETLFLGKTAGHRKKLAKNISMFEVALLSVPSLVATLHTQQDVTGNRRGNNDERARTATPHHIPKCICSPLR